MLIPWGGGGLTVWVLARPLVDGAFTASLTETAAAIRVLAERSRVIAKGAGALAAAKSSRRRRPN